MHPTGASLKATIALLLIAISPACKWAVSAEIGVEEIVFACRQPGAGGHWYKNFGYYALDKNEKAYRAKGRLCRLNVGSGALTVLPDGDRRRRLWPLQATKPERLSRRIRDHFRRHKRPGLSKSPRLVPPGQASARGNQALRHAGLSSHANLCSGDEALRYLAQRPGRRCSHRRVRDRPCVLALPVVAADHISRNSQIMVSPATCGRGCLCI